MGIIDARKQGGERHQLSAFSLSGLFRNYFILLELTLKKISPLLLMIWNSLQPPAVNCVWYGFDPQYISYLTSVPLHFLLNSKSIITIPGRIFFYTYTERMLMTRDFRCGRVKTGTPCLSPFLWVPQAHAAVQGWHGLTLGSMLSWKVCVFLGIWMQRKRWQVYKMTRKISSL